MKALKYTVMLLALGGFALTGCASGDGKDKIEERPVEDLYNTAAAALDAGDYKQATQMFEEVERQHPYSQWATRAELLAAYSSYKDTRYDEAILALDRFIELHPGNKDIDYALYLKALCFYEQISDVARDQAMTEEALDAFNVLIRRFPDSQYSRSATFKRDLTLDHLAGKEMEIGRYYLNRGQVNASINRFRTVIADYQTTTHVPEALHRLVEAYLTLGLRGEATRVAAVLGHNYPGSKWYEDTYKLLDAEQRQQLLDDRDWLDKTVESLFKPD
ncbi:MAG: outer membrane protein assembly factor BamD [Rhodospirillales bacterium]|nr:outer membrane protein assembly factor BamD [Rhodospirillales bacterium]MCB9996680.1 outer membrane protein assembly factor BamD [Rhodospirillales bacterium]